MVDLSQPETDASPLSQPEELISKPAESQPAAEGSTPKSKEESKSHVYVSPAEPPDVTPGKSVFLAGSIEQGKADKWQERIRGRLKDIECTIFDPRCEDWNPDLPQKKTEPQFKRQVDWELELLERADIIAMYIDPKTTSPITLLELGLYAGPAMKSKKQDPPGDGKKSKLIVYCAEKFFRYGNVDMVCSEWTGIPLFDSEEKFVEELRNRLQEERKEPTDAQTGQPQEPKQ